MRSTTTILGLGLCLFGALGVLPACQSSDPGQVAAPPRTRISAQSPVATTQPAPAKLLPGLPDSLQPQPLAPLPGLADSVRAQVRRLHAALGPEAATLRPAVLERAYAGYQRLRRARQLRGPRVLAVADMELPSSEPRLWVIDVQESRLLHHSHVTHGRGSGGLRAQRFSDRLKSACTALGFYRTGDTYRGKHGLSRRLHGLDRGQNGHASSRYVVLHAADYASADYLAQHGQLGNSRGCPALPPAQYRAIINSLEEGSCLFIYGPDAAYASAWLPAQP
ncbi:murein L,D-transpeptidase catalytic domain family protein [Hymenobacter sp. 15J16-1T3B]|uniref:murein L,D-transpeptidase catalytic domain family protein n=1 Tax=Hymenobacter sp. 15J16-1T3B TaxID=2886941 RepID=UPI001D116FD0|nr:murein L,D-transpeptidase catalytic domain family protein [Hymenobacter sp. 15J16-1T3B]MCC3157708.1 murein L,D-transpeptidase catalytic domain family protein [Hymenobacter sp. 15J16-1T3B]